MDCVHAKMKIFSIPLQSVLADFTVIPINVYNVYLLKSQILNPES